MAKNKAWWLLPLLCLAACGNANYGEGKNDSDAERTADSVKAEVGITSPAPEKRKLVRTADLDCKVDDVQAAVARVEHGVRAAGGIVDESEIKTEPGPVKTILYKPDSLKEVNTYTTQALMTVRVPPHSLDSFLQGVAGMVQFVGRRTLKQKDLTIKYVANELKNMPESGSVMTPKNVAAVAATTSELVQAQEFEDRKRSAALTRAVENMQIDEAVQYATITIALAQPQRVYTQVVANPEFMSTTPFFMQVSDALKDSIGLITSLFLALVTVWPLLLLAIGAIIVYSKIRQKEREAGIKSKITL